MSKYQAGDIVMRFGTFGANRDPVHQPVLILAVNMAEKIHGDTVYSCIPVAEQKTPGSMGECFPITSEGAKGLHGDLGFLCVAGESSFCSQDGGDPFYGDLEPKELFDVRSKVKNLLQKSKVMGEVIHSATPEHSGAQGKNHRPYVCLGEIGKNSGKLLCIPISSSESFSDCGFQIKDLEAAGLQRDYADKSFTRDSWVCAVTKRQASRTPVGKFSKADNDSLNASFDNIKRGLLEGEIRAEDYSLAGRSPNIPPTPSSCLSISR